MNDAGEPEHDRQVREYYDHNTGRFLRWGEDQGRSNIHGALWPPGVRSLDDAMNYANELVAREIESCPYPVQRVLDLGCGVGGTLFYLGRRLPGVRLLQGVSLSPVQIEHARRRVPENQNERFFLAEGCFLQLPAERIQADFSYAVESFAHGPDPDRFFAVQAQILQPGGRLVIIDDCLSDPMPSRGWSARHARLLDVCFRKTSMRGGARWLI